MVIILCKYSNCSAPHAYTYDYMGRRATKKVAVNGSVTLHQRYLYRGYLQIACCDLTRSNHPALWFITWDPTLPIATRPLAIQKDGTWYPAPTRLASQGARSQVCSRLGVWLLKSQPAYGCDLTKNIYELYGTNGYIRTAYTYSPYGSVTESGNSWQPIQWSSEYNDTELGLVYYNYRHHNPMEGRWRWTLGTTIPGTEKYLCPEYNSTSFHLN